MRNVQLLDAQAALSFAVQQATRINAEIYRTKYPAIRYRGLVPVDTTGPEFVKSVTYFSLDAVGRADWMNVGADDVPKANILLSKEETTVEAAAIGYDWNLEELSQAQMLGLNLSNEKAFAARQAAEQMIDRVAFLGDNPKGFTGVVNNPLVPVSTAAVGAGASTAWEDKTAAEILADINAALSGVYTQTAETALADTLLLPTEKYTYIGTQMISDLSTMTILQWVLQNNLYTLETGLPLTIRGIRGLATAGTGGTTRMVAYRNSREVLVLEMPMPFRFFPVWQTGPWRFDVPGMFRIGGVNFKLPMEARYVDEI